MKTLILEVLGVIAITLGIIVCGVSAQGNTPVGVWKTIDDDSNEPASYVRMWVDNGELFGKIEKLVLKPGEHSDPKCAKCAGGQKDQPILGMTIISGLRQEGEVWTGGHILLKFRQIIVRDFSCGIECGERRVTCGCRCARR